QARGQEVGRCVAHDRQGELLDLQVNQRHTDNLRIRDADRVERDIDATRLTRYGLQMFVDCPFVEGVDLGCLGGSTARNNFLGNRVDRGSVVPGEENLGPFASKGAGDRTADPTAGSVD